MMKKDYRQEIGAEPGNKTVPWPYALLILAAFAVAGGFGVRWLMTRDGRPHPPPPPAHTTNALPTR